MKRQRASRSGEDSGPRVRLRGAQGFDAFYAREFGERWPSLRAALLNKDQRPGEGRIIRENRFADESLRARAFATLPAGPLPATRTFNRLVRADPVDFRGLKLGYVMDPASMLPALALPLDGAKAILDLCAAPGGKALILAERAESNAQMTLSDRSTDRTGRLKQVIADYLPPEVRDRTRVTRGDGRTIGQKQPESFDAILLDAPCSSEAHVALDPKALADWSESRIERLAKDQYALLTSALGALAPGGFLVYATCALAHLENDGVIGRLLDKDRHRARVVPPAKPALGETTEFGVSVLPDRHAFGPIYFAVLTKD